MTSLNEHKNQTNPLVVIALTSGIAFAQDNANSTATIDISRATLLDRIYGGWTGMLIGGIEGLPHEWKYSEKPRETLPEFTFLKNGARSDDDNGFEWTHLCIGNNRKTCKV